MTSNLPSATESLFIWDAHTCFPLDINADLTTLEEYQRVGVNFVSINVGMDFTTSTEVMGILNHFREWLENRSSQYKLVSHAEDIERAKTERKLAVAFDLEGSDPLNGSLTILEEYYDLGVRQMLLAYNRDNAAAGGCLDDNMGLTPYGRKIIQTMNRIGMLVDGSHMSEKSSLDMMELSDTPVIFSHANCKSVFPHPRNLSDQQIKVCAEKKGVIGINGLSILLGDEKNLPAHIVRHIEYIAELVGVEHVGIGLDYSVKSTEVSTILEKHRRYFSRPGGEKVIKMPTFVSPLQIPDIITLLNQRGFNHKEIRLIMGENFLRLAKQVW